MGHKVKKIAKEFKSFTPEQIVEAQELETIEICGESLSSDDVIITVRSKIPELAIKGNLAVKLDTEITPDLRMKYVVNEFVASVQQERKRQKLNVEDKIELSYSTYSEFIREVLWEHTPHINSELLVQKRTVLEPQCSVRLGNDKDDVVVFALKKV